MVDFTDLKAAISSFSSAKGCKTDPETFAAAGLPRTAHTKKLTFEGAETPILLQPNRSSAQLRGGNLSAGHPEEVWAIGEMVSQFHVYPPPDGTSKGRTFDPFVLGLVTDCTCVNT